MQDEAISDSRIESLRRGFLALDEYDNNRDYLARVLTFLRETRNDTLAWKWVMISLHAAIYGLAVGRCTGTDFFRVLRQRGKKPLVGDKPLLSFDEALHRCQAACPGRPAITLTSDQLVSISHLKSIRNDFMHYKPSCTAHHIESMRKATQDSLEVVDLLAGNNAEIRSLTASCREVLSSAQVPSFDFQLPSCVCSADWSVDAKKRYAAVAVRAGDHYRVDRIEPVEVPTSFLGDLCKRAPDGRPFVGFDFPIGLPNAYAVKRGFTKWREAMMSIKDQKSFFKATDRPTLDQPFYPRTGGTKGQHKRAYLVNHLGLRSEEELFRGCEHPNARGYRPSSLFFTIGPSQVGRAALHGWKHVLLPILEHIALWPFDGELRELLAGQKPVIAEIYPAEFYRYLGPPAGCQGWGKTDQNDRREVGQILLERAKRLGLEMSAEVRATIDVGFDSDDQFDAFVGLIGMLAVLRGELEAIPTEKSPALDVEGWILGRPARDSAQQ